MDCHVERPDDKNERILAEIYGEDLENVSVADRRFLCGFLAKMGKKYEMFRKWDLGKSARDAERVKSAIDSVLAEDFSLSIDKIFVHSRKQNLVEMKYMVLVLYGELTHRTQSEIVNDFGNPISRSTLPYVNSAVKEWIDYNHPFADKWRLFRSEVKRTLLNQT